MARRGGHGSWKLGLLPPEAQEDLRQAWQDYVHRAGGAKTAAGAAVVGGMTSLAMFPRLPYVPATLVGVAGGAYAVQLPPGNSLGDSARQIGAGAAAFWDAVSDPNNWGPQ
mmetsp:Transcript_19558/g.37690  ORF Transcript_19558/g.37690 Transcript_19558/m.37690 type:complete len:111 (-) Transcript_19558:261-593(-)